jgi:hypothetical protein
MSGVHAVFKRLSWPAILVVCLLLITEEAWGQSFRSRGRGSLDELWMAVRWVGLVASLAVAYFFAFHLVFPSLLLRNFWPLNAYGIAWALFMAISTIAALGLLWSDIKPAYATRQSSALFLYRYHLLFLAVGSVLTAAPLAWFRSRRGES